MALDPAISSTGCAPYLHLHLWHRWMLAVRALLFVSLTSCPGGGFKIPAEDGQSVARGDSHTNGAADSALVSDVPLSADAPAPSTRRMLLSFLRDDGRKIWFQSCDLTLDGTIHCDESRFPVWVEALPPDGITLPQGVFLSSHYGFAYQLQGQWKLRNGYVQSDGTQSWSQDCDIGANGVIDCAPAAHPFKHYALPPASLTLGEGVSITSRYTYVFEASGVLKFGNGFLQSDGAKTWFQSCDIADGFALHCDPGTHPFQARESPPKAISLDPGTTLSCQYTTTYRASGKQVLLNGFMQSNGLKSWSQRCEIDDTGNLNCDVSAYPFQQWALPPKTIQVDAGHVLRCRYAIAYAW